MLRFISGTIVGLFLGAVCNRVARTAGEAQPCTRTNFFHRVIRVLGSDQLSAHAGSVMLLWWPAMMHGRILRDPFPN